MNKKFKKITMGVVASTTTIITPIAVVVSCGDKATDELKGIETQFDKSLEKNVTLNIPYISTKKDKMEQIKEYKKMIDDFYEIQVGTKIVEILKKANK